MVNSVSSNVANAWEIREKRNEDQTKDKVNGGLFDDNGTTNGTNGSNGTNGTTGSGSLADVNNQIKEQEQLKKDKEEGLKEAQDILAGLQKDVTDLKNKISDKIAEALKAANKYSEEKQEEIKNTTNRILEKYYTGEITKEEMQTQLNAALGDIDPNLPAEITALLTESEALMKQIMTKMGDILKYEKLIENFEKCIADCDKKLGCLNKEKEKLEAEQKKCDPIGFATEDGSLYDFIIDRNNDGKFNNEQEFLGAEKNWNEMIELDTDKNGKVSADEMAEKGVKVLVTDASGKQSIVDVKDLGIDEIDLSTYKEGNEQIGEGNEVLGTFGITINGKTVNDGYNTLDTVDWLDKHYSNMFTDKAEGKGRFEGNEGVPAKQAGKVNLSLEFADIMQLRKSMSDANNIFMLDVKNTQAAKDNAEDTTVPDNETEVPEEKPSDTPAETPATTEEDKEKEKEKPNV